MPKFHHHVAQWCADHLSLKQKLPWLTFPDTKISGERSNDSGSTFGCNKSGSGGDSIKNADISNENLDNSNNNGNDNNNDNNDININKNNLNSTYDCPDNDEKNLRSISDVRNDNTVNMNNIHNNTTINPHNQNNGNENYRNNSLIPSSNDKTEMIYKQENNRKNSTHKFKKKGVKNKGKYVDKVDHESPLLALAQRVPMRQVIYMHTTYYMFVR